MHGSSTGRNIVEIDTSVPVWEQFFTVAPLVLIGTCDEDGSLDLAPGHFAEISRSNSFPFPESMKK